MREGYHTPFSNSSACRSRHHTQLPGNQYLPHILPLLSPTDWLHGPGALSAKQQHMAQLFIPDPASFICQGSACNIASAKRHRSKGYTLTSE